MCVQGPIPCILSRLPQVRLRFRGGILVHSTYGIVALSSEYSIHWSRKSPDRATPVRNEQSALVELSKEPTIYDIRYIFRRSIERSVNRSFLAFKASSMVLDFFQCKRHSCIKGKDGYEPVSSPLLNGSQVSSNAWIHRRYCTTLSVISAMSSSIDNGVRFSSVTLLWPC